jgi:putative ABC transport system permease protein
MSTMTRNIKKAFRSIFSKKTNNAIRIVSLGIGLAVGLVLIAKVCFEQNYENFYPDNERIYMLQENVNRTNDAAIQYPCVSGGVAPGMKAEIPQVEAATRLTHLASNAVFSTTEKKRLTANFILADNCLFDVLPRPVLSGNAKQILSQPMYAMVSRSVAEKMGKNASEVIGEAIRMDEWPDNTIIIGGVFEDVPQNSEFGYDIVVSLPSIGKFMWDGSENWLGNDRYCAFVKLTKGTNPQSLATPMANMQKRHQDLEEMAKAGSSVFYTLHLITDLHRNSSEVKRMSVLLALLAFAVLFTAALNYILVTLSSLVKRSKEMAVYKCFGAGQKEIGAIILYETFVCLILALLIASTFILCSRSSIEEILNAPLKALFSAQSILWLLSICAAVFILATAVPARIFAQIPLSSVFRNFKESRRKWKLALLCLQFIATAFLITLLVIIGRQYNFMINDNPGYTYDKMAYCYLKGASPTGKLKAIDALKTLPQVESVATCSTLPVEGASGNNVREPGKDVELFNIADLYEADSNYLSLMEIPLVDGRDFQPNIADSTQVLISQKMADRLSSQLHWNNGVVGKSIFVTSHNVVTIVGVYRDFRIGSISREDQRPSALFYRKIPSDYLMIRFRSMNSESLSLAKHTLENVLPEKDIVVTPYKTNILDTYKPSRLFRNAVMIGVIVTLIIVLAGLIGYVLDEINRRGAEIAIRKVNGASAKEILTLFIADILRMAIPALLVGEVVAAISAGKWLENFSTKAPISPLLYVGCSLIVLAIIVSAVTIAAYRTAIKNPVDALKHD